MLFHLYVETCDRISTDFCNSLKLWLFFITYQTNLVEANLVMQPRILIWNFVTYKLIICVCVCVFLVESLHTLVLWIFQIHLNYPFNRFFKSSTLYSTWTNLWVILYYSYFIALITPHWSNVEVVRVTSQIVSHHKLSFVTFYWNLCVITK